MEPTAPSSGASGSNRRRSTPAVSDAGGNGPVLTAMNGRVYDVDAASGKLQWSFRTGGAIKGSPVVAGQRLYVGSHDKRLYSSLSGDLAWADGPRVRSTRRQRCRTASCTSGLAMAACTPSIFQQANKGGQSERARPSYRLRRPSNRVSSSVRTMEAVCSQRNWREGLVDPPPRRRRAVLAIRFRHSGVRSVAEGGTLRS